MATTLAVILSASFTLIPESPAEAGFLKNGVRSSNGRIKTLKPPRAGARKRLNRKNGQTSSRQPSGENRQARKQQHAWFWKIHDPSASAADPSRWPKAVQTLRDRRSQGRRIISPGTLDAIDAAFSRQIASSAAQSRISEALIMAVIAVESRGQPGARSHKGAQGLMQLIPATARRFGVDNAFDPAQNIAGGAAYLDWLLREFNGDAILALAAYNAGEGAVRKHKGVPPYRETRDYVVKVLDAIAATEPLCKTSLAGPRTRCTALSEDQNALPSSARPS
ncbi:MAG: lytic transglycosylase domain-containing protein [Actinomycetota bacterium]